MSFIKVSVCPKCGAPIWNPATSNSSLPPPTLYSCTCEQATALALKVQDLEKKVAALESEIKGLKQPKESKNPRNRELLKD